MTATRAGTGARPRLARVLDGALVGGVASGIAAHVGWSATSVRIVFGALALVGGFGAVLYIAYWIVLPLAAVPPAGPPGASRGARHRPHRGAQVLAIAAIAAAALSAAITSPSFLLPAVLACLGGAFLWRQADAQGRDRETGLPWAERSLSVVTAPAGGRTGQARLAVGGVLVVAAIGATLARADVRDVPSVLIAMVVAVIGVALITGPWWMRLVGDLGQERRERIRSAERAELAARVHDSVLQTLALIQRRADSPREVARLARGQERDLRALLWGGDEPPADTTLVAALRSAAAEVEDGYGVVIDVVAVGDAPAGDAVNALTLAAREAMVNAAKHAGVGAVSLYTEIEDGRATVFVRDRGSGFDPAAVPDDRQGLRRSVRERLERHGGRSAVRSAPGEGTEVEMEVSVP